MRRLFTNEGQAALAAAMRLRPLLAFDFDGTLAPIVARPDDARVPASVAQRLQRLAAILPLAIISGRTVSDLRHRLPFEPWRVVGNHGAESEIAPGPAPAVAALQPARARIAQQRMVLEQAGVQVEDKGASIALHYRLARDRSDALAAIGRTLEDLPSELQVFGGKLVANVVASFADDKAHALARLVTDSGASGAVFIGDDINDEPVFAREEPTWFTLRVGHDYPNSQAQYSIDAPADLPRVLDLMLAAIGAPQ